MRIVCLGLLLSSLLALTAPAAASAETVLRVATLAPQGSAFASVIESSARSILERTAGRVRVRVFWSGQLGDERDMVRRMRLGSLDGAMLATVGLSLIDRSFLVLQLPLLFRSSGELGQALTALEPAFDEVASRAGFEVVAWGEVGGVYLLSRVPPRLAGLHSWLWPDEPFIRDLLARAGVHGVPLGLGEVTPSLAEHTVDAAYGPLLPAIVLGWLPHVGYAADEALSYSVGALVLSRRAWQQMSAEDQQAVREVGKETAVELDRIARRDEARARKAMEHGGLRFVPFATSERARLGEQAAAVWAAHAGSEYPPELLARVQTLLSGFRVTAQSR